MTRLIGPLLLVCGVALLVLPSVPDVTTVVARALAPQEPPVIDIRVSGNTGARRRLAIPDFTTAATTADVQASAKTIAEVLWDDIDFEGEFYVLPRAEAAKVPSASSPATIPYDRWSELGVDALVMGSVSPDANGLTVRVQIVGVRGDLQGKQIFGKIYSGGGCNLRNPRYCAHYIADDFHKSQGIDGVARTRLAFASDRGTDLVPSRIMNTPAQEIYISDYDGANPIRITVNRSLTISPSWSPDGRFLAYTSYATGFPDVYIHSMREAVRPSRPAGGSESIKNSLPSWSPDGSRLAYTSTRDYCAGQARSCVHQEIFVANRDGSNVRRLTNHTLDNFAPDWSPSGQQIVFVSGRSGDAQLYLMSADGTGVEHLSCGQSRCDHPSWSKTTNKIAYTCGNDAAGYDVCVLDMASRKLANLTEGHPGSHEQPTFAPNGRHIVFTTTRWGKKQLAMIDITGRMHERRITNTGTNTYPAWSNVAQ